MATDDKKLVIDDHLFPYLPDAATTAEVKAAVALLCQHLGVEIRRTNKTKHGTTELVLSKEG